MKKGLKMEAHMWQLAGEHEAVRKGLPEKRLTYVCVKCGARKIIGQDGKLKSYYAPKTGSCSQLAGFKKRTLRDIEGYLSPGELYEILEAAKPLTYTETPELYVARDKALVAITYLTAARISEVLKLRLNMFELDEKGRFIIIKNISLFLMNNSSAQLSDICPHAKFM